MKTSKNILGLQLATDPRWVDLANLSIEEILTDHAFCEQKAATTCISLITKYSDRSRLVSELAPIVTEEWGHFRMVLAELEKRKLKLGKQRKDEYVNHLIAFQRKGGDFEERFLDQLLTMAMIEARSCERFKVMSEHIDDMQLSEFYHELMVSEATHYSTFIRLAKKYADCIDVNKRWKEFLDYEAQVIQNYGKSETIHG